MVAVFLFVYMNLICCSKRPDGVDYSCLYLSKFKNEFVIWQVVVLLQMFVIEVCSD